MPYKDPIKQAAYVSGRKNYLKRRARNRAIAELAKSAPCADCGKSYPPYVMDFDHVRGEKTNNVSLIIGQGTVEELLAEIEKCDVVCSNCHRERTWRKNYKTSEEMLSRWRELKLLRNNSIGQEK